MNGTSELPSNGTELSSPAEVEIPRLPDEVLQEIFYHLDGKSLLICKRVCKTWRDNVHFLEQRKTFWYTNCQKEIPPWTLFDLLDNVFPCHWKDQNKVNWELIYNSWCVLDRLYEAPVTINKIVTGLNLISSIKISGEWLLVSTCEGGGSLTAQHLDRLHKIDIYTGCQAVLNFELVNTDRHPHSNVKPSSDRSKCFDTLQHNEIWVELKNAYIQLGKTYCHDVDKIQQRIRHAHGYQVRLTSQVNRQSFIILKKTCDKVIGPELMEIELSSYYSRILDFWTNTISLSDQSVSQILIDAVSLNRRTTQASLDCSVGYRPKAEYCHVYSWHGSLFVIYTSKRKLVIHYGGVEGEQVTPIREGCVTSVLLYAKYFFLGTDRGQLFIYKVKKPEDCLDIMVYETPCRIIEVCQGKIIHIVVAEPVHRKGKGPMIVCATPKDVYLISVED